MSSAAYLAAVKLIITNLLPQKTLTELTNQRAGEVGGAAPTTTNTTVLDQAIELATAEVEDELGVMEATDTGGILHAKFSAELALSDLARKFSFNLSEAGLAGRDDIFQRIKRTKKTRQDKRDRIDTGDKGTGWKPPASGHNPFSSDKFS